MNFGFTEDQNQIRKSASDFVARESSLERIRALQTDPQGYSDSHWRTIAENGWAGAVLPEEHGGIGLGYCDLICITEEFGKGLLPEPLIPFAVLGGSAILYGGAEAQKAAMLPQVSEGTLKLAFAAYETSGRYNLAHVESTATDTGSGYKITGEKILVENAAAADKILATARTSGDTNDREGISLFAINPKAPGVTLTPVETIDRRPRSVVKLDGVSVDADALIGSQGDAIDAVERAVDCATVALCAEMVGGMQSALEMTVAYSHERVQFGVPIGSFQAVKHKAADMFMHLEMARSSMYYAAMAEDHDLPDRRAAISAAKTMCSNAYVAVTKEAIQLHGGIGFTDEHNIHFFYKRAIAAAASYGDAAFHRERYVQEKFEQPSQVAAQLETA
jgi:alkylation response protein AidB-like acyl-CoA dehydrogenase